MSRFLFNDRFVLALAIFVALVLWVQVTGGSARELQRTFTGIPLGWRDIPEELAVLEITPAQVDVTLRGDREIMQDLTRDDFIATVSLAGAESGTLNYFVTVSVPRGIQLVQVAPQTVSVALEREVEEVYPVRVELTGVPNVELAAPSTDPAQVVVNGPASRMREVSRVIAQVDVDGLERDLRERVLCTPVDIRGEPVRGVLVTPRQIDISVPLEASQMTLDLPVRPVLFGELPGNLALREIVPDPAEVSATGPESQVLEISYLVTAPIDLATLDLEDADIVRVISPEDEEVEGEDEEDAEGEELAVGDYLYFEVTGQVRVPGDAGAREIVLEPRVITLTIVLQVVEP